MRIPPLSPGGQESLRKTMDKKRARPRTNQAGDPGKGIEYVVKKNKLILKIDLAANFGISRSGKSFIVGCSRGPTWLRELVRQGMLPNEALLHDVFVILNVCRALPGGT